MSWAMDRFVVVGRKGDGGVAGQDAVAVAVAPANIAAPTTTTTTTTTSNGEGSIIESPNADADKSVRAIERNAAAAVSAGVEKSDPMVAERVQVGQKVKRKRRWEGWVRFWKRLSGG